MDVVAGRHVSGNTLDLGLRVLSDADSQVGAEAFARVGGEIAEGLDVFMDAGLEMSDRLNWQATAGLKWRF